MVILEPVLMCLECVGLTFTAIGHEWCAIKIWNSFYLLASLLGCANKQLRGIYFAKAIFILHLLNVKSIAALGWLISRFTLNSTDRFHQWLLEKTSSLKDKIENSEKPLSSDSKFSFHLFDVCLAQCYANSCMVKPHQVLNEN